jgi:hypothetical protein
MKSPILATICVSAALLLALAPMAAAEVPQLMQYQGHLTDSDGLPLDTAISMTFAIYDDSTGGGVWWSETQMVEVIHGLFAVQLGSMIPMPDTVMGAPIDPVRFLGVQVGADPEIYPRTRLLSVPYAFRVATVDGAEGGAISGDLVIQNHLDLGGDLRAAGKATVGSGHSNAGEHCSIPGGESGSITSNANHSMLFGKEVYINTPYRVVLFNSLYSGRLGLNRDDHDAGGVGYPIHVGTDVTNGNGAYLTNGGYWVGCSSRDKKDHFQPLDPNQLFRLISGLPVQAWQFTGSDERHIGPVAEDFVGAFDVGVVEEDGSRDDQHLSAGDVAGVALAGVKELIQENQELKKVVEELEQRIANLENTQASGGRK